MTIPIAYQILSVLLIDLIFWALLSKFRPLIMIKMKILLDYAKKYKQVQVGVKF